MIEYLILIRTTLEGERVEVMVEAEDRAHALVKLLRRGHFHAPAGIVVSRLVVVPWWPSECTDADLREAIAAGASERYRQELAGRVCRDLFELFANKRERPAVEREFARIADIYFKSTN